MGPFRLYELALSFLLNLLPLFTACYKYMHSHLNEFKISLSLSMKPGSNEPLTTT